MIEGFDYLHVLDGRIRVKVPEVRRSRAKALEVERALLALKGVTTAKANILTGNILVLYRSHLTNASQILKTVQGVNRPTSQQARNPIAFRVSKVVFQSVAEMALERAFLALL